MGPLIPLLFLLSCIIAIVIIAALIKGTKAQGIFLAIIVIIGAFVIGAIAFQIYLFDSPAFVFRVAFEEEPPADVSSLQGEISAIFDLQETWLYFKANRTTVERLISDKGMQEISREKALALGFTSTRGAPNFWQPFATASARFFRLMNSDEILIYNEHEGEVFFRSREQQ